MSRYQPTPSVTRGQPAAPRLARADDALAPPTESVPGLPHTAAALAGELERSRVEQPRVGDIRLLVRRDVRAVAGLEAGLLDVLKKDGLSSIRLESRTGAEIPLSPGATARSLVKAILEGGATLVWAMPAPTADRLRIVGEIAMASGRMIDHGAHRWQCTSMGAWQRTGTARPAAQPLRGKPSVSPPVSPPSIDVRIGLPIPQRAPVRRTALELPALPLRPSDVLDCQRHLFQVLSNLRYNGTVLEDEEIAWLGRYAHLMNEAAAEQAVSLPAAMPLQTTEPSPAEAPRSVPVSEQTPARAATNDGSINSATADAHAQGDDNQALFKRDQAKTHNHDKRKARLHELIASSAKRPLTPQEQKEQKRLRYQVIRDDEHQKPIDRLLDQAVERRAHLVAVARTLVRAEECRKAQKPIPTQKGALLVYPRGVDPTDEEAMARWLMEGYEHKHGGVRSAMVDFQISWSQESVMDREWMAYVIRRIAIAIGRDPDQHVFAASHEPDVHPPSKEDGKPIHPHAHVMVLTNNADGSTWRCGNIHLVAQRELECINRERGWGLTSSAVAKGAQQHWYTPQGSWKIGWEIDRVFTSTDSPEATRAAALEVVPAEPGNRPGAGLIIVNQQNSKRREALRRLDAEAMAKANAVVKRLLAQAKSQCLTVPRDVQGRLRLRYFSQAQRTSGELSKWDQILANLAHAVICRDAAASRIILKKIDYYSN